VTAPGPWIAVCGPGDTAAAAELATAEEAGAAIAEAGGVLVCGGLGGVMEAACRGARSRGGVTVGLLPGSDRTDANGWVTLALPTGLGEGRNVLLVRAADAVVAVGGGWGTLSEIALALRAGVPVLGVRTWQLARSGEPVQGVREVDDAVTAVAEALRLVRIRHRFGTDS
jgi:uncharacterized protein (TIGR00725 family)